MLVIQTKNQISEFWHIGRIVLIQNLKQYPIAY